MASIGQIARIEDQVARVTIKERFARELGNLGGNERTIEWLFITLADWDAILPDEMNKFITIQRQRFSTLEVELEQWLLSCAVRACPASDIPSNDLLALPVLFPFRFTVQVDDLRSHPAFNIQQQGLNQIIVQTAGPSR